MKEPVHATIYPDGNPCPDNRCVVPDHYMTTITIKVRSLSSVSPSVVKRLVETKYEVIEIEKTATTCVAKNMFPD